MISIPAPVVEIHDGISVVRDDLIPGGTKARYLAQLFDQHDEVVYASPAYGGAQLALAYCARSAGKRAAIFTAKRKDPHPRTREARAAGARVFLVPNGYLSNVQAKAKRYAEDQGAFLVPFGGESPAALAAIAGGMAGVWEAHGPFDQVWSAAGSGVLSRGLQQGVGMAGGQAAFFAVKVGRELAQADVGAASIIRTGIHFEKESRATAGFPSCPNYDMKAWERCRTLSLASPGARILFWNVLGPSPTPHL